MKKILRNGGIITVIPTILYIYIFQDYSLWAILLMATGIAIFVISLFLKHKVDTQVDTQKDWIQATLEKNNDEEIKQYIEQNHYRYYELPGIAEIRKHYENKLSTAANFDEEYKALKKVMSNTAFKEIFSERFSVKNLNEEQRHYKYQLYIESVKEDEKEGQQFRKYLLTMLKAYNGKKNRRLLVNELTKEILDALNASANPHHIANLEDALELFRMEVGLPTYWHFIYETSLENYNPTPNSVENECWMDVKNECLIISDTKHFPLKEAHEQTGQYFKAQNAFISIYQPSCKEEYDKANFIEDYEQIACIHIIKKRKSIS